MSRSPYAELQNLSDAAIADMNSFDRLLDATYRATERYNDLDIDPFEAGTGVVTCIGSRVLATEYKFMRDELGVDNDELVRTLSYAPMVAEAHFVGIWSRTDAPTAALYTVEAPFALDKQDSRTSFSRASAVVLSETQYNRYRSIGGQDGVEVFARDSDQLQPAVVGNAGTTLQVRRSGGRDTLSDPPAVGLRATITGPAAIRLPGERFFQAVHPGAVLASPEEKSDHDVYFKPGQGYGVDLRVSAGSKPEIGSEGQIVVPGEPTRDKLKHNPKIDAETAYGLLAGNLNLTDITPEFVAKHREKLEKFLLLDETLFRDVARNARRAVVGYIAENAVRERALGLAPVTARIASLLANFEGTGASNRLINSKTLTDSSHIEKV
jgi:hypothetical protein